MELSRDVTFEEDVAYRRSRRTNSDSDDSQEELLASPSPPVEKETMEDDVIEPIDPVDPIVPDPVPRDTVVLGQKRRPAWTCQSLQDDEGHPAPRLF